ncbi:MAG: hypothetical protein K9L88_18590 [Chromatiaceae bacterium]|nr:hypothetical protein [Chromatiaceae bacterium]
MAGYIMTPDECRRAYTFPSNRTIFSTLEAFATVCGVDLNAPQRPRPKRPPASSEGQPTTPAVLKPEPAPKPLAAKPQASAQPPATKGTEEPPVFDAKAFWASISERPSEPASAQAKPADDATDEPQASFADFWRSLNQPDATGDDQPEAKAPKPPAKIELPALDTEGSGDAETPPSGEFKAFWGSVDAKTETGNSRFWKSVG